MNATTFQLNLNGAPLAVTADGDKPLLWVLRDELKLKGTKYGCGVGVCGICTVLLDGAPNHACRVSLGDAAPHKIMTIEGIAAAAPELAHAWLDARVPQCGYCQPGQIMAACALRNGAQAPGPEKIEAAMSGVLCRCGTYARIRTAVARWLTGSPMHAQPAVESLCPAPDAGVVLDPFIRIHGDDTVTLQINHSEMGQGALTAMAMLAAEELELELAQIRTEFAPADPVYKNPLWGAQFTGGSSTVRGEWTALRQRAAQVRERLIAAAMQHWNTTRARCRVERGVVIHDDGTALPYAALASDAAQLAAPRGAQVKTPREFRIIGKDTARPDVPDMIAGRTRYAIDLDIPGMRVAMIARCPFFGGEVARVDDSAARRVPGVSAIEIIDAGVAVVADCAWNASRGRDALNITWNTTGNPRVNNAALRDELAAAARATGKPAKNRGNAPRAIETSARVIEADYQTPYLAHVTMEPPNCIAWVRADGCDVWVGTQSQVETHATAARVSGLPKNKVRVHTQFMGGGFGRRLNTDFVAEAVQLSKRIGAPVQTIWSRDDDLQHGFYRPAAHVYLRAALGADGLPSAWWMRVAGCDMALDGTAVPYAIANFREERVEVESPLPSGAWRSVGASQHCFAIESFVDELAHAAGRDPIDYRRALLASDLRLRTALDVAREGSSWRAQHAPGVGYGVAVFRGFGSFCALVAEVDRSLPAPVRRITCALDCGHVVNPDVVRAQIEGGIALGLSAALHEELRVDFGRVNQATFRDYPILTYAEMPKIDIHLIASADDPGGVGEPPVPPVAPAVANALFAAGGPRARRLPLLNTILKE